MKLNLQDVIRQTNCEVLSDIGDISFTGVAPLSVAQPEHISFLVNEKYLDDALKSNAGGILCAKKTAQILLEKTKSVLLVCADPYAAFAKVSQTFFKPKHPFVGISPLAMIDPSAEVDPTATIFPFVFIGPNAKVGKNSVLYSGCFLGADSIIGENCLLYPNVVIREGCQVGDRCLLNPGVVIGAEGFGFAPTPAENVKIPQIGGVSIGDDVEVGANTVIARGAMEDTKVGKQTKVDALVMLAHNVKIGEFGFLAAQSGIAGSSTIGNHCMLGGQAGVAGHLKICDNVVVTAQSGISKNITAAGVWQGSPARPQREYAQQYATLSRLAKKKSKGSSHE